MDAQNPGVEREQAVNAPAEGAARLLARARRDLVGSSTLASWLASLEPWGPCNSCISGTPSMPT